MKKTVKKVKSIDSKKQDFEKLIKRKINELYDEMFIDHCNINVLFSYRDDTRTKSSSNVFSTRYIKMYRVAVIEVHQEAFNIYLKNCRDKTYLIDGLVHELSHLHTIPLGDLCENRFITEQQLNDSIEELTELMAEYARSMIKLKNPKIYNN